MRRSRKAALQPAQQILDGKRALLKKLLHQLVVALGDHLDQLFVRLLGRLGHVRGNLFDLGAAVAVRRVDQRLHGHQIHHAAKIFFRADGQLHRHHAAAESLLHRFQRAVEIGQLAVHPVDHNGARQFVLGAVVPHLFRDHLHAGHASTTTSAASAAISVARVSLMKVL